MSHTHLSREERIKLESYLEAGRSQKDCARLLGRSESTISDEISRNKCPDGFYRGRKAHKRSCARKWKPPKKLNEDLKLQEYVIDHLLKDFSPEQISGRLYRKYGYTVIHHDTIYWWIYQERRDLILWLRQGKRRRWRRKRGTRLREKQRELKKKRWIHERPAVVDARSRIGDWEGDTVKGRQEERERILTYVERKSGYLVASLLPSGEAEEVRKAVKKKFRRIPKKKRYTFTHDGGTEFAYNEMIEKDLDIDVYTAHPYCSHERGTNENTNGLLRQYFPKKSTFATITPQQLKRAVNLLNHRPRKRLNYATPYEVFHGLT